MRLAMNIIAFGLLWAALYSQAAGASTEKPWRLRTAIGAPEWFTIGGSYRLRYETLSHPFRAGASGSDQILVQRFLLSVGLEGKNAYAGAEFLDARAYLDDGDTPLGTDDVNAAELLQAYAGLQSRNLLLQGDRLAVQGGRMTLDLGSRRLIARNGFRNTINAFSGLHADWSSPEGTRIQAFYLLPVNRQPAERAELERNAVQFDDESLEFRLWGVHAAQERLWGPVDAEVYLLGLEEDDRPGVPTPNRELLTSGFRLRLPPSSAAWDFDAEAVLQTGTSRESAASLTRLDHRAGFVHAEIGRTLEWAWSPRVSFFYDFASGDDRPGDGANNRFDPLFSVRRYELGAIGIYGAVARSNISSPGVRLELKPGKRSDGFVAYRPVYLASKRDAWIPSGLQDETGSSGGFVGQQIEGRVRFSPLRQVLRVEVGAAWLIPGRFQQQAPNAPREGDPVYFYTQFNYLF